MTTGRKDLQLAISPSYTVCGLTSFVLNELPVSSCEFEGVRKGTFSVSTVKRKYSLVGIKKTGPRLQLLSLSLI